MILIEKSRRLLTVLDAHGNAVYTCPVQLGSQPVGAKRQEGDGRTPEGKYRICTVNRKSKFHMALGISYPNRADALLAYVEKRISLWTALRIAASDRLRVRPPWHTPLGGYIMIHGEHPDGARGDWTAGCIAVTNDDIERLTFICKKRETVKILP